MSDGNAPLVGICDYGVGNLRSVERALTEGGARVLVASDPARLLECDGLVLPGVGAFVAAAAALHQRGIDDAVVETVRLGRPILGVCLGFQLLFEESDEGAGGIGLGVLPGCVRRLDGHRGKVPHVGWNQLAVRRPSALLGGLIGGEFVYFVHSYAAIPGDASDVVATADYGGELVAAVERGAVQGTQFHPEKSGAAGLRIYANFVAGCTVPVRT